MPIDLHTHSTCSDGSLSPTELVLLAAERGIDVLALTDHDSTSGIDEASRAAVASGMTLVPGVEISTLWRGQDIHVLGLWIDPASTDLRRSLASQTDKRRQRIAAMCARLNKLRLPGDELLAEVNRATSTPTRTHLAQALVNQGHVEHAEQAFRKYLAKGKPGHVAAQWPALEDGVRWIVAAGGCAVLAHPARYKLSSGARQKLLADFAAAGGEGLEIVSGGNGAQHAAGSAALAQRYGFKGSVGSDFHSPQFAWNPLGRSLKLPDSITPVWHGRLS